MKRFPALVLFTALAAPCTARDSSWVPYRGVDLLEFVDLKHDLIRGDWTLEKGILTCAGKTNAARVVIPYLPPEEYDLVVVAERFDGVDALTTGLVSGNRQFVHGVDGYTAQNELLSGFEMLDGKVGRDNESRRDGQVFTNGKATSLRYVVRKGHIRFIADGKEVLDWKGDFQRLGVRPDYRVKNAGVLFIGAWMSQFRISRMTLYRAGTETGRPLREKPR